MKRMNVKMIALCSVALLFYGCEKEEDALVDLKTQEHGYMDECRTITFESGVGYNEAGFVDEVTVADFGSIGVEGIAIGEDNQPVQTNRAMIFDSENPTGDDDDLSTNDSGNGDHWGNVLIVQDLEVESEPNDNHSGAILTLTFPEPVTLSSMRVLDIDNGDDGHPLEDESWVYLYTEGGGDPIAIYLDPHGDNVGFDVNLLNTENVVKMVVVLDGSTETGAYGSGAIDNIVFCVPEEVHGCTYTQGYWKTHSGVGKNKGGKYDSAWDDYLNATLGDLGKYPDILWMAPKNGNADIILAHQYIAAILNIENGASTPDEVDDALEGAEGYFNGDNASRSQLLEWAEILDDYNNGIIGPGHCDD